MASEHARLDPLLTALLRKRLGQAGPWPAEVYRHITREARARSITPEGYLSQVEGNAADLSALVAAATVGHTGFFRHPDHFEQLARFAQAAQRRTPVLRVWSLGCSTGEEAWSIALCLRNLTIPFQVWASDVNPRSIEVARRGVYGPRTTSGLAGAGFEAPDELRRSVRFEVSALSDPPSPDAPPRFDVIFCRNLLIYLEPEAAREAFRMFLSRIERWGAVVVGPVESLNYVPVELCRVGPLGWFERVTGSMHRDRPTAAHGSPVAPVEHTAAEDATTDLDALFDRASRELSSGDLEHAERTLHHALARRDDAVGWFLLGEIYARRAEPTQARVAYARAVKAHHVPAHADLHTIREAAKRRGLQLKP